MYPASSVSSPPQILAVQKFEASDIQVIKLKDDDSNLWFTSEEIGLALGLTEPRIAVSNIFRRHQDELEDFSSVINLITEAGLRETRIYSEEGLYLITMFARSQKAKEFRKWVVNLVKSYREGKLGICKPAKERAVTMREERLILKEQRLFWAAAEKIANNIRRGSLVPESLDSVPILQQTVKKILESEPVAPTMLNTGEACEYLSIGRTTYCKYIKEGRIKTFMKGYRRMVKLEELNRFLGKKPAEGRIR